MAPLPVPSLGQSVVAVFKLEWKRTLRGRKLRLGIIATALVVAAGIVAGRVAAEVVEPAELMEGSVRYGFFGILAYLLPFLFTSGSVADDVETRTFPYLAMRSAGRFATALGKYLTGAAVSVGILTAGVLLLHVGAYVTDPGEMVEQLDTTFRYIGALSLLALCYCAICLLWGTLVVEAAGLVSTLYLALVEFGLGLMPGFVRLVSMNYLATQLAGLPRGGFDLESVGVVVPEVETWICGVVVGVVGVVFLALASLVVKTSEFGFGKA